MNATANTDRVISIAYSDPERLAEFTPVEVDSAAYAVYDKIARLDARIDQHQHVLDQVAKGVRYAGVDDYAERIVHLKEDRANQVEVYNALEQEWVRRGRWTRAFLVNNSNGHVHKSMHCSTCFVTTSYHWVTEFSAHDEAEIVAAAGERACTVCYPSAPVEVLNRATTIFTPDEQEAQRKREERAAKKAAAQALEIKVDAWFDYGSHAHPKTFKTQRALTNAVASDLASLCSWGPEHPFAAERWLPNIETAKAALADTDWDYDEALAKARKKVAREGSTPKF